VPATNITFKRWKGKPVKDDMAGKHIVEYDGRPIFAELAIVQMAVRSRGGGGGGWSAFWQEAYPIRQSGPLVRRPKEKRGFSGCQMAF
jgi:hypothetical protein